MCDLLVCPVRPFVNTTRQCKRCNQVSNRRRRAIAGEVDDYDVATVSVKTRQFYLVEKGKFFLSLCIIRLIFAYPTDKKFVGKK